MKRAFDLSAITADLPTLPEEGEAATENARPRSAAVPIAKAIETQHRNAMAQLKALEAQSNRIRPKASLSRKSIPRSRTRRRIGIATSFSSG